jgi:preprotein translocase subunit SecB
MRWLFPLIGINDRENMVRILRANLPPTAFPGVRDLIRTAIGSAGWAELARRVPELEAR